MSALAGMVDGLGAGRELPERPDDSLDPYLDAAVACVERYGWSRLSPKDIARAAGVERTTVYRHLGSKSRILELVIARDVHRLIDHATAAAAAADSTPGPHVVVEIVASAIEYANSAPALRALISEDDPELLAGFFGDGVPAVIDRFVDTLTPLVAMGIEMGVVARRDPQIVVDWAVRMGLSVFAHPPRRELRPFLAEALVPLLTPDTPQEP